MKCPKCGYKWKNKANASAGRRGGLAKVPKGFYSPGVRAKALATRRAKQQRQIP